MTAAGLVAVGSDSAGGVTWTSADGTSWTVDPASADLASAKFRHVAEMTGHLVVLGMIGRTPTIWWSDR